MSFNIVHSAIEHTSYSGIVLYLLHLYVNFTIYLFSRYENISRRKRRPPFEHVRPSHSLHNPVKTFSVEVERSSCMLWKQLSLQISRRRVSAGVLSVHRGWCVLQLLTAPPFAQMWKCLLVSGPDRPDSIRSNTMQPCNTLFGQRYPCSPVSWIQVPLVIHSAVYFNHLFISFS